MGIQNGERERDESHSLKLQGPWKFEGWLGGETTVGLGGEGFGVASQRKRLGWVHLGVYLHCTSRQNVHVMSM